MRIIVVVNCLLPFFICYSAPGETKALKELQKLNNLKEAADDTGRLMGPGVSPKCTCSGSGVTSDSGINEIDSRSYTQQDSEIHQETYGGGNDMMEIETISEDGNSLGFKDEDDPNVIKQVIFIEPPEYIYKHEFSFQQPKPPPKTVIYVFPPEVKHVYNITDNRVREKPSEPIVYYLTMNDIMLNTQEQLGSREPQNIATKEILDLKVPTSTSDVDDEDNSKRVLPDGLNIIDPRTGNKKPEAVNSVKTENPVRSVVTGTSELGNRDQFLQQDRLNLAVQRPPSVESQTFYTDSVQQFQDTTNSVQIPQDRLWNDDRVEYSSQSSSNAYNQINFFDSISEETRENDFEIIPAILQRYLYVGPDPHLYQE